MRGARMRCWERWKKTETKRGDNHECGGVGLAGRRVLCRASHIDWHTGRGPGPM